jgi:hypothetical protein
VTRRAELLAAVARVIVAVVGVLVALHALTWFCVAPGLHCTEAKADPIGFTAGPKLRIPLVHAPPRLALIDLAVLVEILLVVAAGTLVARIRDAIAVGVG